MLPSPPTRTPRSPTEPAAVLLGLEDLRDRIETAERQAERRFLWFVVVTLAGPASVVLPVLPPMGPWSVGLLVALIALTWRWCHLAARRAAALRGMLFTSQFLATAQAMEQEERGRRPVLLFRPSPTD